MLIWESIERTSKRMPDSVALVSGEQEITYGRLAQDVGRLAVGFEALGLLPGDRIALALPSSPELVIACLAAARAALVVVSLPVDAPSGLLDVYLSAASPKAVVTNQETLPLLPEASLKAVTHRILTDGQAPGSVSYASLLAVQPAVRRQSPACCPDPLAFLVFTSGTTGRPKAVAHTQARLVKRAEHLRGALMLTEQDRSLLVFSPLRSTCFVFQVLAMFQVGGTAVLASPKDSESFWDIYARVRPTYSLLMPAMTRRIFEHPCAASVDHSLLRFLLTSGDNPGPDLIRKVEETTGKPLLNVYGMTEVGPVAAQPLAGSRAPGSMGKPLEEVAMRLVDENGRDVHPGETGRLLVRTPNWMAGYWNDTLRTHQAICSGWFDTHDFACMDQDGFYWFRDRDSDVIIRNAINVATALVVDALLEHPALAEAVIVGLPDATAGQVPVAFYLLKQDAVDPAEEALHALVSARVDAESVPVAFHRVGQWPLTRGGKLDRAGLVSLARAKSLGA